MAGCVTLVSFNASASPSNIMSVMENPKISFAVEKRSFATALSSYKSLPIPTNWAPCPGNIATFIHLFFRI